MLGIAERIRRAVLSWPGTQSAPHRYGGVEFRVGRAEIGHLHGSHLVDIPFPRRVRDELVTAGRARPHHVLPESGWVSVPIAGEADVEAVIELLKLNYERLAARHGGLRSVER